MSKRLIITNVGKGTGQFELSYTAGENRKWYIPLWKIF
jgi:hypothetical protein